MQIPTVWLRRLAVFGLAGAPLLSTRVSIAQDAPPSEEPAPPPAAEPAPLPAEPAPEPPPTPVPTAPPEATAPAETDAPPPIRRFPSESQPNPRKKAPRPAAEPAPTRASEPPPRPGPTPVTAPPSSDEPPPPRPTEPPKSEPKEEKGDDSNGLFGPFRLGPVVGVGLPNLLSVGGTIKLTRFFGAGINVGLIPTLRISYYGEATLAYEEYDAYGRIYPFGGAFFLGAGVGYANVRGTLAKTVDLTPYLGQLQGLSAPASVDYKSDASVQTLVLTPQIGLFHTFGSGFSLGIDVGAQIPIAPSHIKFNSQVDAQFDSRIPEAVQQDIVKQYTTPTDDKVRSTLETIGRTPIPTINLRVGWLL